MLPDYVKCVFWTDKNLREADIILKVTQEIISFGEPFIPNKMLLDDNTRMRYVKFKTPKDYDRIKESINTYDNLKFGFMKEENDYFHLSFGRRSYDGVNQYGRKASPNTIGLELERHLFSDKSIVLKYLEACKCLYLETEPYYGYIHESDDVQKIRRQDEWLKIFHTPQFCLIYWANFFGPSVVENYGGKSKFLDAPCWKVEELSDGGILLLLYPNPLDPDSDGKRSVHNRVLKYFDLKPMQE
jgi:hypothetical protein